MTASLSTQDVLYLEYIHTLANVIITELKSWNMIVKLTKRTDSRLKDLASGIEIGYSETNIMLLLSCARVTTVSISHRYGSVSYFD